MRLNEGQDNRMIKDNEGLSRCNLKDVEYVDSSCRGSLFEPKA